MLDGDSSILLHRLQDASLILLGLVFVPFDLFLLLTCYVYQTIVQSDIEKTRSENVARPGSHRRNVLVTGVGMTKGLALARLFYEAGHTVVGADFEPKGALACGRFSNSVSKFYRLQKPSPSDGAAHYTQGLLDIVSKEKIDIWVSCSGVASAVEDGQAKEIVEAKTSCKAVQFDVKTTQMLHEKDSFIDHTKSLGLTVPETHLITKADTVFKILQHAPPDRKYIMKTIGVVDIARGDMTLLPKATAEETSKHIMSLPISDDIPWILQQYINGPEYCTHALVIKGQVKAFLACPSAELLMHYEGLPADSALCQTMLEFTRKFSAASGDSFTGHLSFDFLVENEIATNPDEIVLYPIECNPRAHTAVALFNRSTEMVDAYISLLDEKAGPVEIVTPAQQYKYYWIGHDLISKLLLPACEVLLLRISLADALSDFQAFFTHILFWRDGTFEVWDPLPWFCLYHIYWPMQFLNCLVQGKKWSRINVSTTKMFEC